MDDSFNRINTPGLGPTQPPTSKRKEKSVPPPKTEESQKITEATTPRLKRLPKPPVPSKERQNEIRASRLKDPTASTKEQIEHTKETVEHLRTEKASHIVHKELEPPEAANRRIDNEIISTLEENLYLYKRGIEDIKGRLKNSPNDEHLKNELKEYETDVRKFNKEIKNRRIELLKDDIKNLQLNSKLSPELKREIEALKHRIENIELDYNIKNGVQKRLNITPTIEPPFRENKVRPIDTADATKQGVKELEKKLNVSIPPPEYKDLIHLNAQYKHEKDLILNINSTPTQLSDSQKISNTYLERIIKNAATEHAYATISKDPWSKQSKALLQGGIDRVESELASLNQLMDSNPEVFKTYPEFNQHIDTLTRSLNIKKEFIVSNLLSRQGQATFTEDLQHMSDAVKILESAYFQKVEVNALLQSREIQIKSNELSQIIDTLKEAKDKGFKQVAESLEAKGLVETKKRERKPSFAGKSSTETNKREVEAFNFIFSKIKDVQPDSNLRKQTEEIDHLILSSDALYAIFKKDRAINNQYVNFNTRLLLEEISTESPFNIKLLLKPPGNPEVKSEFLSNYRSTINEFSGDKSLQQPSHKLFALLMDTFNAPETSLYEKQQLMRLAIQWVNDPKVNNYELYTEKKELSALVEQIKLLADFALLEGSPTLRDQATTLSEAIKKAETLPPPK